MSQQSAPSSLPDRVGHHKNVSWQDNAPGQSGAVAHRDHEAASDPKTKAYMERRVKDGRSPDMRREVTLPGVPS